MTADRGGAGGGCSPYPKLFANSPIAMGEFDGGTDQVSGIASDAVARLGVLLANGQWLNVPLAETTYAVELPLAHLPARLGCLGQRQPCRRPQRRVGQHHLL